MSRQAGPATFAVGYASGVFDLFHVGHLTLLRGARGRCRRLVVGVASDEYVERLKGRPAVVPCAERVEIVSALGIVDDVVVDGHLDKRVVWRRERFDAIFKGDDWRATERGARLERDMQELGVAVVYLPYTSHTSTTALRQRLAGLETGAAS